ncbi:hypothetical protein HMPREF9494_01858 [Enterococcus faecalis TX2137]|nr:hypothetical protein HMPREF9494_01858 [Enterococcus faecalis TX2137]
MPNEDLKMTTNFSKKTFLLILVASIILLFSKNNIPDEVITMFIPFSLTVFKPNSID